MTAVFNKLIKGKWTPLIVLPFILAVCAAVWLATFSIASIPVQGEYSTWDLREFDFSNPNHIAAIRGEIAYIPNALLTPDEFEARAGEAVYGSFDNGWQYATSRIRLLLPDGWYALNQISVDFSQRVYINGELIYEVGSTADNPADNVPDTRELFLTAMPKDGVIEIVTQSSNFVHRSGGGHGGWGIANPGAMTEYMKSAFWVNVIIGCYLAMFIVHIIIYIMHRSYKENLLFALLCLVWFLYCGVERTKVFSVLFSWMSWFTKFRIEYLTFPAATLLFIWLIHTLFPDIIQKWFRLAASAVMGIFAAIFLLADTVLMSHSLMWCMAILAVIIFYTVIRFILKLRKVSPEQLIFIIGAAIFMYASANDMFFHIQIGVHNRYSRISMLIFTFFGAAAVALSTARGIEEAKAKEQRLADHIRFAEKQLSLQREQYKRLTEHAEHDKTARHDMRHQLAVLKEYGADGDLENLNAYLDKIAGSLPTAETAYCMNYAVNAVIAHHLLGAADEGIRLDIMLDIPEGAGGIDDMDLCVVMGNLLENAVDALRRMEHGERFIRARSLMQKDYLSIAVENSFDGAFEETDGVYLSRKREGSALREGVGLSSVKAVCEKYNGSAVIGTEGNMWHSTAVLMRQD